MLVSVCLCATQYLFIEGTSLQPAGSCTVNISCVWCWVVFLCLCFCVCVCVGGGFVLECVFLCACVGVGVGVCVGLWVWVICLCNECFSALVCPCMPINVLSLQFTPVVSAVDLESSGKWVVNIQLRVKMTLAGMSMRSVVELFHNFLSTVEPDP